MTHNFASMGGNMDGRHSIDITSALFVMAAAMFVVNILPCLAVGFYQDDFKSLDLFQDWGWNLWRAIQQDGVSQGFRPFTFVQRLLVWNIVGEHPLVHRLILALIHLGFGWILARGTRLLGGSRLHAAITVVLYFASTVTRETIYRYVAFIPSDILSLSALLIMIMGVNEGWSPGRLGLWTFVIAALAVFSKENGIAASGGVLLLTVIFWRRLSSRHRIWIFSSHALLLAGYLAAYLAFSSGRSLTLASSSLTIEQTLDILKGVVISLAAPFSAIYLSMRNTGLSFFLSVIITLSAILGVAWFFWWAYGRDVKRALGALRARLGLGVVVALLVVGFLVPYLPGKWFEMRMLVSTFAMGTLFWGMILGDALQAWASTSHEGGRGYSMWGVGLVVILAALAAGTPLSPGLTTSERTGERMREIVREAQMRGMEDVCLVGFPTKGSFLRGGNAQGLVGYESKRQMAVYSYGTIDEIPDTLDCVVVSYDEGLINDVPLTVRWPGQLDD